MEREVATGVSCYSRTHDGQWLSSLCACGRWRLTRCCTSCTDVFINKNITGERVSVCISPDTYTLVGNRQKTPPHRGAHQAAHTAAGVRVCSSTTYILRDPGHRLNTNIMLTTAVVWCALLVEHTSGFVATSASGRRHGIVHSEHVLVRAVLEESASDSDKQRITAEGVAKIRERGRQRTNGVPMKEWSRTSDRDNIPGAVDHERTRDPEREAAADTFIETFLSDSTPDGFGEGLDSLVAGDGN